MNLGSAEPMLGYGAGRDLVVAYAAGAQTAITRFCDEQSLPLPPPDGHGLGEPAPSAGAHRAQLSAILTIACYQLRLIEDGSPVVRTGQLELWVLREPGHLRRVVRAAPGGFLGWRRVGLGRLAAAAQRLEAELFVPLTRLREALIPPPAAEFGVRAWETMREVASRLDAAASGLSASGPSVERLSEVVARMEAGLPDLERQAAAIGGLDDRIRRSAEEMVARTRPLVDFALNAEEAVVQILEAVTQSRKALDLARLQFDEASRLAETTEERREAITTVAAPLVHATSDLTRAAGVLDETATRLWNSIQKANWLALVADGIRNPVDHFDARFDDDGDDDRGD